MCKAVLNFIFNFSTVCPPLNSILYKVFSSFAGNLRLIQYQQGTCWCDLFCGSLENINNKYKTENAHIHHNLIPRNFHPGGSKGLVDQCVKYGLGLPNTKALPHISHSTILRETTKLLLFLMAPHPPLTFVPICSELCQLHIPYRKKIIFNVFMFNVSLLLHMMSCPASVITFDNNDSF